MSDVVRTSLAWAGFILLFVFIAVTVLWPLLCLLGAVIASAWGMWRVEDDAYDHPECFDSGAVRDLRGFDRVVVPEGTTVSSDGRYLHLPPHDETTRQTVIPFPVKGAA